MNSFDRLDLCKNLKEVSDINRNSNYDQFELDHANNYYGIQNIIKKYANLPVGRPLYGSWPHGIHYDGKLRRSELSLPYLALYSYETFLSAVNICQKRFPRYKPIFLPSAVPIVFAKKIILSEKCNFNKIPSSIIIFPSHSSLKLSISLNIKKQIKLVQSLRKKFKHISLCLAWKDVLENTYSDIYNLFDSIYCAGHQYDKDFLYNLVEIFSAHTRFTGDYVGSYLWYGTSIGSKPYFDNTVVNLFNSEKEWKPFNIKDRDQEITNKSVKKIMNDVHLKSLSIIERFKSSYSMNDFQNQLLKECNFCAYQDPNLIYQYEKIAERYFKRFGLYSCNRKISSLASKLRKRLG